MKRKFLKTCAMVAGVSLLFTSLLVNKSSVKSEAATMRSASEIVKEMGVGWNLGNTLDAKMPNLSLYSSTAEYETGWGNPVTTKAMIDKVRQAGFKTIRIPITWGQHMDSNNNVTSSWMRRVKEVVNYAMDDGFYVIINVHHDGDWCVPDNAHVNSVTPKLQALWKQIATEFKNYDDHLIFETLNEPRLEGTAVEWTGGNSESRNVVNKYNEAALKTIRSTGGNNATRAVMMPTYAASTNQDAIRDFKVPNDRNVIASIHAYSPYYFAMDSKSNVKTWGSSSDKSSLDSELDSYLNAFKAKGVPVVIGEWGSINKANLSSRVTHAEYYVKACQKRGIPCVWWDNNFSKENTEETFGIFNRSALNWYHPEIKDALIRGYKSVHPDSQTPSQPAVTPGNTANLKDGWYYIKNVNAQKYLTVAGNTGKAAQNVELRTGSGIDGQKWYLKNIGNGYVTLKSALGNFMLDIANAKNTDGANIQIYNSHSGTAQQFMLKTTSVNNAYVIATKCSNLTKVLDDYEFSKADGTNVCQWTYGGKENQQWILETVNNSTPSTPSNPEPTTPSANKGLTLTKTVSNWGSAYQVNIKISNKTNANVNSWTLKIKKSDLNIGSSWNVNIKEEGNYYVITPVSWNSFIQQGGSVEFGIQGNGSINSNFSYELTSR